MKRELEKLLQQQGFIDWGGDPSTEERLPLVLASNYQLVNKLYAPKEVLLHIEKKGRLYITTYIPATDFNKHQQ